jgi:hypothetical protein
MTSLAIMPEPRPDMTAAERLRREGHEQGRQEGLKEGRQQYLITMLEARLGTLPAAVLAIIRTADQTRLDRWFQQGLLARTLDDARRRLRRRPSCASRLACGGHAARTATVTLASGPVPGAA